ncbi:helix-turn-helix domain-containing protein [Corynebacterium amycolatum]|nr:helix-turn-helix domain-containing protein [Corynebacterium amycolatum]
MNTRSRITPGDVSRVGTGRRLGLAERLVIAEHLRAGHSHRRIAQIVCRSQSTVSREIARNSVDGIYDAYHADQASRGRLARPKPRKLDDNRFCAPRLSICSTVVPHRVRPVTGWLHCGVIIRP